MSAPDPTGPDTADAGPFPPAHLRDGDGPLRLTRDGPLAVLTMDSPPVNVFDLPMWAAWADAVDWLTEHPPRALLVRSGGRIVSSGVDVEVFAALEDDEAEEFWESRLRITRALERLPCPTVFAAHSLTLTAAFELALACDLIVATASARFGLVERRIGFTPSMGGTQRLAERAGPGRARELVMTGDLYRGAVLADWGVVNALFEPKTFHEDAHAYARRLAEGPTRAHGATKEVVRAWLSGGVDAADAALPGIAARVTRSADHRRGVAGFLAHGPEHDTAWTGD
ncbi:enoyl-CoA hydratase/isomerase family protein [Streptomyces sp. SM14]|uniref:enoyl-CoA hydratase/isomerase family protein n=2 Tax=unclassified Streptomyces TaxID=2593676 RepID=UPI001C666CE8|nr:enoyl-CoA hydratase/isomerase family protein [Streptomyces sp. SM14]